MALLKIKDQQGNWHSIPAKMIGGGESDVIITELVTATGDMTSKQVLTSHPYTCYYKNSLIIMGCFDNVTPTSGSYTIGSIVQFHQGTTITSGKDFYSSGRVTFNSLTGFRGMIENHETITISANGLLGESYSGTSPCVANGGTFKVIEIPLNASYSIDTTRWGEN